MNAKIKQFRQGDVLLERVPVGPSGSLSAIAPISGRYILQFGETTGHAHAIAESDVLGAGIDSSGDRWFNLAEGATELHEDHTHIVFPESGWHRQRLQREYAPRFNPRVLD